MQANKTFCVSLKPLYLINSGSVPRWEISSLSYPIGAVYGQYIPPHVIIPSLWWIALLRGKQHSVSENTVRWEIEYSGKSWLPLIFVQEGPASQGMLNPHLPRIPHWKSKSWRLSNAGRCLCLESCRITAISCTYNSPTMPLSNYVVKGMESS